MTSGTSGGKNEHAAVRAAFPAYRLGLLDADRAQALRVHVRECADCRAAFVPFAESTSEEEDRQGHVALAILARWDHAMTVLPEAERELLEAHVASCTRCEESRAFGRALPAAGSLPTRPPRRLRFGVGMGAAIAAVLALVVLRDSKWSRPRGESPPAQPRSMPTSAPAPAVPGGAPGAVALPEPGATHGAGTAAPFELGGTRRSAGGLVVRVAPGTTVLPLRVPPLLGVGPAARIRITVTGPDGSVLGHAELAHRALFGENAPPALEAHAASGSTLVAGSYEVRVVSDAPDPAIPGAFEHADYGFRLEVAAGPAIGR